MAWCFVCPRRTVVVGLSLVLMAGMPLAHAQSQGSLSLSALPVASVIGVSEAAASMSGSGLVSASRALSTGGAVLVVRAVDLSADGVVWVLERMSDGARASLRLSGQTAGATSVGVGTVVTLSLTSAGALITASGEVLAFIPNALGEALMDQQQVTR